MNTKQRLTPTIVDRCIYAYDNYLSTIAEMAREYGVRPRTLASAMHRRRK